ncbi:hypothetical protein BGZ61DRAFT_523849 [Ilyonectria robusta]|uniref:uncharacterized protein n=1 Tax=Ilyonectria robusta TaxID=1079257 RepID=UPI001E8E24E1|nr:uncharacterized protein BGZ61DRAFT_523849 [Ilyonectria robusta]KAH8656921.1 hypothetical protein BGZ61DRAFT_523849 [Ilyonectria robusta]
MSDAKSPAIQYFGLSCPDGGDFYICDGSANEFIGCCTIDPCADGSGLCEGGKLRTASFDADKVDDLTKQSCDDSRQSEVWWICENIDPPFLGCCDVSPCSSGCPRSSLLPAVLSTLSKNKQAFLDPEAYAASRTTSKTTSVATSTATSTASATTSAGHKHSGGLSTGAVAGIAAGSAAVGVMLLAILIWKCWLAPRKRKQNEKEIQRAVSHMQTGSPGGYLAAQSPAGYYQESPAFVPNTGPQYPSGFSVDHDGKLIPHYAYPNFSSVPQGYGQAYSPLPTIAIQETDGTPATPQELGTGHELGDHRNQDQTPATNHEPQYQQEGSRYDSVERI